MEVAIASRGVTHHRPLSLLWPSLADCPCPALSLISLKCDGNETTHHTSLAFPQTVLLLTENVERSLAIGICRPGQPVFYRCFCNVHVQTCVLELRGTNERLFPSIG